ncbi:glycosyltransferase [Nocardia sp. NPDC058658]|uniref:glycosyltransferase n=1 Tax=Nocardia sp. NPDC058658 TaxID=3346580 RepID=UPI00364E7099
MRIFYFTKFPPLQGGMSARGLFIAKELGRRGHEVHIFSDSLAAEPHERVNNAPLRELLNVVGDRVSIHWTEAAEHTFYRRHPGGRPAVSQLASLALSAAERNRPDVIMGSFMEPFGVAAHLVSKTIGVRLVTAHAGSDIGRLMRARDSQFLYHRILLDSSAILTTPRHSAYFVLMGISPRRLHALPAPAPAWAPSEPAPLPDEPPTVLIYGKLPADDSYLRKVVDDCAQIDVRTKVVGHAAWPASSGVQSGNTLRTLPFVWPWKVPDLISGSSLVAALRSSGTVEVPHHHGLTAVEAAAMGRPVALHSSDAANFHMTGLGLPTSHSEMMSLLGGRDAGNELAGLGKSCFDWLQGQLSSGASGLVLFASYVDRIERVLTVPDEPADESVVTDRVSRLLNAPIQGGIDRQVLRSERRDAYQPVRAALHYTDRMSCNARIVRRVPIRYTELPDQQYYVIAHSAGSHPHEHILPETAFALLRSADGTKNRVELEPGEIMLLQALSDRGLIALCDADLLPSQDELPSLSRIESSRG